MDSGEPQIFEKLFGYLYAHDEPKRYPPRAVEEVVNSTVTNDNGGDPLLFPFLVLEAKREQGAQNFEQMEIQTAFPIRNMLKLQYDVAKIPGNTFNVPGGPLVWFFTSRGEDWRVYGAVINEEGGRPNYIINYLWGGSLTGEDEALQLILIVDYIIDWARDNFRESIKRQLKSLHFSSLGMNNAMTSLVDSDIYSIRGEVQPWMDAQDVEMMEAEGLPDPEFSDVLPVTSEEELVEPFAQFKCATGLVRDAQLIESRLRAVYITRDNLKTLLGGFKPNAHTIVRSILASLDRHRIELDNEELLNTIKDKWTGNVTSRSSFQRQGLKVYSMHNFGCRTLSAMVGSKSGNSTIWLSLKMPESC